MGYTTALPAAVSRHISCTPSSCRLACRREGGTSALAGPVPCCPLLRRPLPSLRLPNPSCSPSWLCLEREARYQKQQQAPGIAAADRRAPLPGSTHAAPTHHSTAKTLMHQTEAPPTPPRGPHPIHAHSTPTQHPTPNTHRPAPPAPAPIRPHPTHAQKYTHPTSNLDSFFLFGN